MPLGFFGGQQRPQPLESQDSGDGSGGGRRGSSAAGTSSNSAMTSSVEKGETRDRGAVVKLHKHTVTIDRKLAEGGFAIVYLVVDKQNRNFALKRQFLSEDQSTAQFEACKREAHLLSRLKGHKNIVHYVDHLLAKTKTGVYDYMLLTVYYKTSVLQLMNERLMANRCLRPIEVLDIFCDMCEAVAALHQMSTPVIHRDLKVENILIDERNRSAPPIYVLCDFGSATTQVLSTETQSYAQVEEEIQRYTTLSYRAPEMIDLYSGKPIGTASDIWALGVMLYRLSYFQLPFGESAMAIQNGAFSFPATPDFPLEIKAIIKTLLEHEYTKRPTIYQTSSLAFQAAQRKCPVPNPKKVPTPLLADIVKAFRDGCQVSTAFTAKEPSQSEPAQAAEPPTDDSLLGSSSALLSTPSGITSVNPRLRPKPVQSVPRVPNVQASPKLNPSRPHLKPLNSVSEPEIGPNQQNGATNSLSTEGATTTFSEAPLSCPPVPAVRPADLGFTDLEDYSLHRGRAQTEHHAVNPFAVPLQTQNQTEATTSGGLANEPSAHSSLPSSASFVQQHRRNVSDCAIKSAFKPYHETQAVSASSSNVNDMKKNTVFEFTEAVKTWNPFTAAPFGGSPEDEKTMDDARFGECFDILPRRRPTVDGSVPDGSFFIPLAHPDDVPIDESDPFGAAPFDSPLSARQRQKQKENDADSVGSSKDLRQRMAEAEESDADEQRMQSRRRFSYEHIDGVGDDASSDSRGCRTDDREDSTDEVSKDEKEADEVNGGGGDDSSQSTDVAADTRSDDLGGSRPLLDDDELDDEQRHAEFETDPGVQLIPSEAPVVRRNTNPFLVDDLDTENHRMPIGDVVSATPQPTVTRVAPPPPAHRQPVQQKQQQQPVFYQPSHIIRPPSYSAAPIQIENLPAKPQPVRRETFEKIEQHRSAQYNLLKEVKETPPLRTAQARVVSSGAATLPRQSTPLVPPLPLHQQSVAAQSVSQIPITQPIVQPKQVIKETTVQAPKPPMPEEDLRPIFTVASSSISKSQKEKKEKKSKSKKRATTSSSEESNDTDDSGAEMFASANSQKGEKAEKEQKKQKKKGVAPTDLSLKMIASSSTAGAAAVTKKSSSKKRDGEILAASFVNSSFQAEDTDSPPQAARRQVVN